MTHRHIGFVAIISATIPFTVVTAQRNICLPGADSHEAHAFAILSVPFAFTGALAPGAASQSSIGVEVANLPQVDRTNATPTACRPDKGPENTNPIPGLIRPRLAIAWRTVALELSWIPPVRVDQVKASLVGLALTHQQRLSANWSLALRAHAVLGSMRAPVTCDDDALRDPRSDCYQGTRSDDRWQPGIFGIEAALGVNAHGRFRPYAGVGYTLLRPRFEVNFTNASGSTDNLQVQANLQRIAVFAGLTAGLGRSTVTAEAYATPEDAIAARLVVRLPLAAR